MVEDITKIIRNGYETFTKNFNLSFPFLINIILTLFTAVFLFVLGFIYILGSSLENIAKIKTPEEFFASIIPQLVQHIVEIIVIGVMIVLIIYLIEAFFSAGAIGMAKQATETGKSALSTMFEAGKKNIINLFFADILVSLLSLAGIVFMVPGAMMVDVKNLLSPNNTLAVLLLFGGFLLLMLYLIIMGLLLTVYRYALVIEGLGPIEGITAGFGFFKKHKGDVFILWLVIGAIMIGYTIIDIIMGQIPYVKVIWSFVSLFISILVIPPLMTLWWVRLYMTRTDKKIYINDLLAHPNDLENPK
jgi:hypothetical protein